jgi:hypothetical protein
VKDYISHGDFLLPLEAPIYWLKHLYVWSFQTGAPNLDGIIRLPGRLVNLLIFQLFGNTAVAYFYLASSFVICFLAFYCFARLFLKIKSWSICVLGAMLFAFNPIFLGNFAKVGLIIAVAMLPLCLVLIQRSFERRRLSYLLIAAMVLNISLIHPFTFTVNLLIAGGYFVYKAWQQREFIKTRKIALAVIGVVVIAMNAYFLLPISRLGTVNKEALSQDITATPVDYTTLIDIANTGDVVTALSLSKNVLKDFEFYNPTYAGIFFIATFALYAVLLGLYIYREKHLSWADKRTFVLFVAAFLGLALLSTGTLFSIDAIIRWLIDQPGGWMFRSPLKWQLYMPLFLFGALVLLLYRTKPRLWRVGAQSTLIVVLILMNAYILADIYTKLLTPRKIDQLSGLMQTDLSFKTLLFVSSNECTEYARLNPTLFTEFNQVTTSYNVQLKRVNVEEFGSVHVADYDYAMACQPLSEEELAKAGGFSRTAQFADGALALYKNQKPNGHVFAFDQLFALATLKNVNVKDNFVTDTLKTDLRFVEEDNSDQSAIGVYDIFEGLSTDNIKDDALTVNIVPTGSDRQTIYLRNEQPLYYKIDGQQVVFDIAAAEGYQLLEPGKDHQIPFTSPQRKTVEIRYKDPNYSFTNLIPNPSMEEGLWQEEVGDCNRYDDSAKIGMSQTREDATDGQRALQLEAERHIACTWTPAIPVKEGAQYLLSFDYQSVGTKPAAFFAGFNDENESSVSEHLPLQPGEWTQLGKVITVPKGATSMHVVLYAFADSLRPNRNIVRYDNFSLVELPLLQSNIYLVSHAPATFKAPRQLEYKIVDPTTKSVEVRGATTPFYLAVNETYHDQWQLSTDGGQSLPSSAHIRLNNGVNGWFVDPKAICAYNTCAKNDDGSFDMQLTVEFAPQKWMTIGTFISAPVWVGSLGYVSYDWWRHRRARRTTP